MKQLKLLCVKKLYATVSHDGCYLDITSNKKECERWNEQDINSIGVMEGYGIFNKDTRFIEDEASDFYYTLSEAEQDLKDIIIRSLKETSNVT